MSVSKEMLELADRITSHLVTLATTSMKLPLAEWGIISNDVLSAVAALRASAVAEPVRCFGCGSSWTDDDLRRAKAENSLLRSCCPERKPLTIDQWQKLAIAHPAPAAPVPASVREVLQHALARFECLEDHFEETGDEALRAMSSVDADRMQAALASLPAPEAAPAEDVRWAVNYLLEQIAAKFESWDTFDLWRSDAASTVRSFKRDLSKPEAAPTWEEIIEQCAKIARQYIFDMSDSRLDDRDISWIRAGADRASGEITDAILALKAAPAK